jgi:hypothetical protein
MYAFIDEAGDPGIGRGTDWLLAGCAIVDERWKERLEDILFALSAKITGGNPIHFRNLSHGNKKGCYQRIVELPWWGIVAITDTNALFPKRLSNSKTLYYEVLTQVIRRVLWRASEFGEVPDIVIDARHRRFDLDGFRAYLRDVDRDNDPKTNWDILDINKVAMAEPDEEWCLGLADGLVHALHKMLEPHDFAGPEQSYFSLCWEKLWKGNEEITNAHQWAQHRLPGLRLDNGVILLPEGDLARLLLKFPWATN